MVSTFGEKVKRFRNLLDTGVVTGVSKAILFGSVVRGEANSNSDIDVMLLLDSAQRGARLGVLRHMPLWVAGERPYIDLHLMSKEEYDRYDMSLRVPYTEFLADVRREGVSLWEK